PRRHPRTGRGPALRGDRSLLCDTSVRQGLGRFGPGLFGALRWTQPPPRGDRIEGIRTCLNHECEVRGTLKADSNTVSVKRVALIGATGSLRRAGDGKTGAQG